ncbi:MAG: hypothetical protein WA657_12370 [Candidatus Acidiferrales bacterium]
MEPNRISLEEKERLTGQAANLFKVRHPEYLPSVANSEKLIGFIESQLGMSIFQYPYPLQVDNFEVAYEHIKQTSWFFEREPEIVEEDPAIVRERNAQQKVRDDHAARVEAEQIQRDKNMPLKELGAKVSRQNADFRAQREQNLLPTRTPGLESRHVEQVQLGIAAQARVNVGLANPSLDTHSAEFSKKCAVEVARLRG